ncbi:MULTISPECIES: SET domain-containing protein-lysine N-methyltransferase [unclassified Microcoleus]|uniref:SET domain-containing protein-lysine N-methyltransferase n=1 Tax=unclassified Microcoleus TaxID=2642155 RepID=UPI002FD6A565
MLLVKTKLGISFIHAIGLFAAQFIPKGTVTWEYSPYFDTSYEEADVERMSPSAKEQFLKYAYFDNILCRYVLCFDDQRFINHCSESPNILSTLRRDVAAVDIYEGEELVCNYNCYDDTYFIRLGIQEITLTRTIQSS